MRRLAQDPTRNAIKLGIDSMEDLWALKALLQVGDHVTASTTRTAESTGDKIREGKAPKVRMTLTVQVEQVEWHGFADQLRVLGPITAGPQDVSKYHTLSFGDEPGQDLEIAKPQPWAPWEIQVLDQAIAETGRPQALLLAIDDEEAQFAHVLGYGLKQIGSLPAGGQGKRMGDPAKAKRAFFDKALDSLKMFRTPVDLPCLVVGPGWWREEFLAHVAKAAPELAQGLQTEGTSQGGRRGLYEALQLGLLAKVAHEHRIQEEGAYMAALWKGLSTGSKVAVGVEVDAAFQAGAIERLLVSEGRTGEDKVRELLKQASLQRIPLTIVSAHHEDGAQFERMGGLAALLHYDLT